MSLKDILAAQAAVKQKTQPQTAPVVAQVKELLHEKTTVAPPIPVMHSPTTNVLQAAVAVQQTEGVSSALEKTTAPVAKSTGLMASLLAKRGTNNAEQRSTGPTPAIVEPVGSQPAGGHTATNIPARTQTNSVNTASIEGGDATVAARPTADGKRDGRTEMARAISQSSIIPTAIPTTMAAAGSVILDGNTGGNSAASIGIHESLEALRKNLAYLASNIEFPEIVASTVRMLGQQLREKPELAAFTSNAEFDLIVRGFRRSYNTAARQKTEARDKKASKVKSASEFENIFRDMDIKI